MEFYQGAPYMHTNSPITFFSKFPVETNSGKKKVLSSGKVTDLNHLGEKEWGSDVAPQRAFPP